MKLYRAIIDHDHDATCKTSGKDYFAASIDNAWYWANALGASGNVYAIVEYDIADDTPVLMAQPAWGSNDKQYPATVADVDFSRWTIEGEIVTAYSPVAGHVVALASKDDNYNYYLLTDGNDLHVITD